jgi:magnesium transporter
MSNAAERVGDCGVYENGRRRPGRIPLHEAGDVARSTDGFVWIGLQQASRSDIEEVAERFKLPDLAVHDVLQLHYRPKLQIYDDVVFVVLKPVHYINSTEIVDEQTSIALFLGPGFVVSVRNGVSDVLRRVREEMDAGSDLLEMGPTAVLYRAMALVVDGYDDTIDKVDDDMDRIEEQVFGPKEGDHSRRIYQLKQEVAEFRRAVGPLARPLERLASGEVPGVARDSAPYFRHLHDHAVRAESRIEGIGTQLSDVLQANLARVTMRQTQLALEQNKIAIRQNEDMRKISAWAAIALVPTAIAGIYGMNFDHMPELEWQFGYPLVLCVIATVCIGLHRLFHRNGWL